MLDLLDFNLALRFRKSDLDLWNLWWPPESQKPPKSSIGVQNVKNRQNRQNRPRRSKVAKSGVRISGSRTSRIPDSGGRSLIKAWLKTRFRKSRDKSTFFVASPQTTQSKWRVRGKIWQKNRGRTSNCDISSAPEVFWPKKTVFFEKKCFFWQNLGFQGSRFWTSRIPPDRHFWTFSTSEVIFGQNHDFDQKRPPRTILDLDQDSGPRQVFDDRLEISPTSDSISDMSSDLGSDSFT